MRPARMRSGPDPVVLVAHGSQDHRAAVATRALVRAVELARPGLPVRAAYLDHTTPGPVAVLHELEASGHRGATVVPLLLTAAYHGRVDIPGAIAAAQAQGLRLPVRVTDVLGPAQVAIAPDELLLAGLRHRLAEAMYAGAAEAAAGPLDGLVLAAAGTRVPEARRTVEAVAGALGEAFGVPSLAAYASAAPPTAGAAVARLRAGGARRIGVAAYFLAPGRLYESAVASARAAGAVAIAAPLTDSPEIARLVLDRVAAVSGDAPPVAPPTDPVRGRPDAAPRIAA
ncbi:CbiX/SirB N-terminal domain-containing protein [Micromonospora sp. NPDC049523]|uniref:sirohydrochlorin chelatase n=1 Tax=Micromonospora sp. NPDC049523 TaxID=3155921 RepID=UPI0034135C45